MTKRKIIFGMLVFLVLFGVGNAIGGGEIVGTLEATVCCEKTNSGLHCQDVPEEDCSSDSEFAIPTACTSTSPCDPGYCYDATEGTCLDNVPQMICNEEGGTWSGEKPEACGLGCCILGDQASFVTLVRCKRLSSFYGLETNWNGEITDEPQCILTARAEEKGACVFTEEFELTCKLTSRSGCGENMVSGSRVEAEPEDTIVREEEVEEESEEEEEPLESPTGCEAVGDDVKFCPGMLCSADELGTVCGPSTETTCLDGHEEIYFVDTCGNPANIYDGNKISDADYWTYIKDKGESCFPEQANENSQTCGNCNYLLGSYCRGANSETARATYGENICMDLNCPASEETGGEERLHGESWCGFDVARDFTFQATEQNFVTDLLNEALRKVKGNSPISLNFRGMATPVGSEFYRYVCSHGEVLVEPCASFRNAECIESNVAGYSESACRVNRWQDCTSIYKKLDCENTDRRDCLWMDGPEYVLMGGVFSSEDGEGGTRVDKSSLGNVKEELKKFNSGEREIGACVPKNPPGLQFWGTEGEEGEIDNSEAMGVCSQANAVCPVTYEKGLIGGDWECVKYCECLEDVTQLKRAQLCMSLGDCGPKVNYAAVPGRTQGYKIFEEKM
ncbi:MAG: hypothetical protein KJ600_01580 [Nanoarchaeota archaeon]|nr:hypothetical protein [Nanoarchaeota archaeon]MBU1103230.1 hypothetical protein [Nanoarchaeota archaeon]